MRPEGGREGAFDLAFCSVNLNYEIFTRFSYLGSSDSVSLGIYNSGLTLDAEIGLTKL